MDSNNNCEEVVTEVDNELIESSVKRALECLCISANECPIGGQQSDNSLDLETTDRHIDGQSSEAKVETRVESNGCDTESAVNCTDSVADSPSNTDTNNESTIETNEREDNAAVDEVESQTDEQSDTSGQSCDVYESETNYMNAIISPSLGQSTANRYPLQHRWQLWFWRADPGIKVVWHQALQQVCKPFDTIEDFWRLYHHIVCVQQLEPPSDYCVFKEGIDPMWEHHRNINGGKWSLGFAKLAINPYTNRLSNPYLDEIWLEVLLCLIGEGFNEFGEEICGAVVNVRAKEDRICVWTANANKSVANLKIGEILKMRTGYEGQLKYEAHTTAQRIAEAKDRLFTTKPNSASKPSKPNRHSCVF